MARNKSPGTDRFQVDMYVIFWLRLEPHLMEAHNYALAHKLLHESVRRGVISLLLKKERDITFIKNWRPIVLLNTDYKILSKAVAFRIKSVLNDIIHTDQTGFMSGRSTHENIRKLIDAMEIAKLKNMPMVLI